MGVMICLDQGGLRSLSASSIYVNIVSGTPGWVQQMKLQKEHIGKPMDGSYLITDGILGNLTTGVG